MEFKFGLTLALVLAVITKGHSQLQCYVCENCAKIDKNTPLQMCGPDTGMTTTMMPQTDTTMSTTTAKMSTTDASTTTSRSTSTEVMTSSTTAEPTPPTIGPSSSTTSMPTPPNVGPMVFIDTNATEMHMNHTAYVDATSLHHLSTEPTLFVTPSVPVVTVTPTVLIPTEGTTNSTSNSTNPSTFLVRQRRNIPENGMTWHCYRVQKKYDNMYGIQRGCMGVTTEQSVCSMLKAANNNQTHKCRPCSTSMCNSSTTIEVSIATMLVALVALIYKV